MLKFRLLMLTSRGLEKVLWIVLQNRTCSEPWRNLTVWTLMVKRSDWLKREVVAAVEAEDVTEAEEVAPEAGVVQTADLGQGQDPRVGQGRAPRHRNAHVEDLVTNLKMIDKLNVNSTKYDVFIMCLVMTDIDKRRTNLNCKACNSIVFVHNKLTLV